MKAGARKRPTAENARTMKRFCHWSAMSAATKQRRMYQVWLYNHIEAHLANGRGARPQSPFIKGERGLQWREACGVPNHVYLWWYIRTDFFLSRGWECHYQALAVMNSRSAETCETNDTVDYVGVKQWTGSDLYNKDWAARRWWGRVGGLGATKISLSSIPGRLIMAAG